MNEPKRKSGRLLVLVVCALIAVYLACVISHMATQANKMNERLEKIEQMSNKRTVINKTIYWYKDEKHNLDFKAVSKT